MPWPVLLVPQAGDRHLVGHYRVQLQGAFSPNVGGEFCYMYDPVDGKMQSPLSYLHPSTALPQRKRFRVKLHEIS